jgi:hypothetical protein
VSRISPDRGARRATRARIELPPALLDAIARHDAVLFTGAGFSTGARDGDGRPLPTSEEMIADLWRIVFGDEPRDASTLEDLYDVALNRCPGALAAYVDRRLRVGPGPLPDHYAVWFGAPWRAIYTLNVDDLEAAAAAQLGIELPPVFHLNGRVGDDIAALTFSTRQYGARLAARQQLYEQLVDDLERYPFVFVGTTLDESPLWQHLERRRVGDRGLPRSFLVARSTTRARRELLDDLGITWVEASAEEVAALASPSPP